MYDENRLNKTKNSTQSKSLGLGAKFVLLTIIILSITLSGTTAFVLSSQNQLFKEHLNEKGNVLGDFVSLITPEAILSYDFATVANFMAEVAHQRDISYAFIVAPDGSNITPLDPLSKNKSNEISKTYSAEEVEKYLTALQHRNKLVNMEFPILFEEEEIGRVKLGLNNERLNLLNQKALYKLATGSTFIICFLALGIYLVFRINTLKPINQLVDASIRISNGNLTENIVNKSNDELGHLSKAFNTMMKNLRLNIEEKDKAANDLRELNKSLEERVHQRTRDLEISEARIRAIFDNMGEGVITFNDKDEVISTNPSAARIFGFDKEQLNSFTSENLFVEHNRLTQDNNSNSSDNTTTSQATEFQGYRSDGSIFPMDVTVSRMKLGDEIITVCITRDITRRKESEIKLTEAHDKLIDAAHQSGMAEMAVGVLHNIGNILNSVSLSAEEISRINKSSKLPGLIKANNIVKDNLENIGDFVSNNEKGKLLPQYYLKVGQALSEEKENIEKEIDLMFTKTEMMKDVISTQQEYARTKSFIETTNIEPIIEDSIKVQESVISKLGINIIRNYDFTPPCDVHKSKLLQVLTNLIKNASEAMRENDRLNKTKDITIDIGALNDAYVFIKITDTGIGIDKKNLDNIFTHGFTTKSDGHGFGLHTSANAMTEMHGSLKVKSDGLERGASFTLLLPINKNELQSTSIKTL